MKKKIIALFAVVALLVTMCPVMAMAAFNSFYFTDHTSEKTINVGESTTLNYRCNPIPAGAELKITVDNKTVVKAEEDEEDEFKEGKTWFSIIVTGLTAGTAKVTVEVYEPGAVEPVSVSTDVTVNEAASEFTVELDQTEFTYNGKTQVPTYTVKDKDGKVLTEGVDFYVETSSAVDAGEVRMHFRPYDTTKYKETIKTYTIKPAKFNISLDKTEFTYNGQDQIPNVTVTGVGGDTLSAGEDYEVKIGEGKGKRIYAGTYEVTVVPCINNYETTTTEFVINPAKLNISLDKTEFVYNGQDQIPNVTVTGVEGDTLSADKDYEVTFGQAKRIDVGTYTVKAASFNSNYVASDEATFKIVSANENVPKTGDSNNAWLYIVIAVVALGTALGAGVVRKKANR